MSKLSDVIARGVLASRPAAASAGRLYEATDTTPPTVYRDNGSSWDVYAIAGTDASGTLVSSYVDFTVAAAPSTPASGVVRVYAKTGKHFAQKDDTGLETLLDGGSGGGGASIQYPPLKPATPTDDFTASTLAGAWSAHSSGGSFATSGALTQARDGSYLRIGYEAQMGMLLRTQANTDLTISCGGLVPYMKYDTAFMMGIAALDASGDGAAVVVYNDGNCYLASIVGWQYSSVLQTIFNAGGYNTRLLHSEWWLKLARTGNNWVGSMSFGGFTWNRVSASGALTKTITQVGVGLLYNTATLYDGALELDWFHQV